MANSEMEKSWRICSIICSIMVLHNLGVMKVSGTKSNDEIWTAVGYLLLLFLKLGSV